MALSDMQNTPASATLRAQKARRELIEAYRECATLGRNKIIAGGILETNPKRKTKTYRRRNSARPKTSRREVSVHTSERHTDEQPTKTAKVMYNRNVYTAGDQAVTEIRTVESNKGDTQKYCAGSSRRERPQRFNFCAG